MITSRVLVRDAELGNLSGTPAPPDFPSRVAYSCLDAATKPPPTAREPTLTR